MATVLIGEDTADLAALFIVLMDKAGHTVRAEPDGSGTLAAARAMQPDLLILDVQLPGQSGLDVCRAVRVDPELYEVAVGAGGDPFRDFAGHAARGDHQYRQG